MERERERCIYIYVVELRRGEEVGWFWLDGMWDGIFIDIEGKLKDPNFILSLFFFFYFSENGCGKLYIN